MTSAVISVALQGVPIIEAQRTNWQIKPNPHTDIGSDMIKPKGPGAAVHKASVIKDCSARFSDHRKSKFHSGARHCLAADRLAVLLRTDLAKRQAAEIIGAPEKEPLENWHFSSVPPLVHGRDFAVNEQDEVLGQMKILRSLQVQCINLGIAPEKTPANKG